MLILGKDESSPYDVDLQITRLNIPDNDNAIYYFKQASEKLNMPDGEEDRYELINNMFNKKNWDSTSFDVLMKNNEETFKYFEQGLQCAHSHDSP